MDSPVLELQRAAYDQKESVSGLLSKAYILSRKLKIEEFSKWAYSELNGYTDEMEVPEYRILNGQLKAFNPYQGYIPTHFETDEENSITRQTIPSPLSEIESLTKKGQNGGKLTLKLPPSEQRILMNGTGVDFEFYIVFSITSTERILDKIRNIILEWTLKLEEEEVYGEGMTFSKQEKEKAIPPSITIIGNMINSQYQQNTEGSTQKLRIEEFPVEKLNLLIDKLHELRKEVTDQATQEELDAEVLVLKSQLNSPNPKKGIIREALLSIKNIAEGATGGLVAAGIQDEIVQLLTTLSL